MDKAETAIRNALLKIDARDKATRKKIYQTAWEAHERSILADEQIDDVGRNRKRDMLRQAIQAIEAGFHTHHDEVLINKQAKGQRINKVKTVKDKILKNDMASNETHHQDAEETIFSSPKNEKINYWYKKKKPIFLMIGAILFFVLIAFIVLFYIFLNTNNHQAATQSKPQQSKEVDIETLIKNHLDSAAPNNSTQKNTPTNINIPKRPANNNDGFINILNPVNANTVATLGAASVDLRNNDGTAYLRIYANSAEDAAVINIGEGALNNARGKNILLDIDARSEGAQSTQMSITCDLGQYNNCGRRRFNVPRYRDDILLQIQIPENSKGPAKLYLTSDVFGEGHAINIYSISFKLVD